MCDLIWCFSQGLGNQVLNNALDFILHDLLTVIGMKTSCTLGWHLTCNWGSGVLGQVLWCFFTASLLWMSKILFVKTAANSFHRAAYFDRIQDCLFHQYVLETISQPKPDEDDYYWGYSGGSAVTEVIC